MKFFYGFFLLLLTALHAETEVTIVDSEDPTCVGSENTYTITLRNKGAVTDKNVMLTVTCSPEMQPLDTAGPTPANRQGQVVRFRTLPALGAKQEVVYTLHTKAIAPGDGRIKVVLNSDLLAKAVTCEESTQIY